MGLSADDIENQEFSVARKGYDRAEVDRFRAKTAKRVRKLEKRVKKAQESATPAQESTELTRHIGEILKLAGEQAQRATDEAEAAAAEIIAAARSEAAQATNEAEAARNVALAAIEAVRLQVAETIEAELGLHDELDAAASAIRGDGDAPEASSGSSEDPLAQVVRDAVGRASNPRR